MEVGSDLILIRKRRVNLAPTSTHLPKYRSVDIRVQVCHEMGWQRVRKIKGPHISFWVHIRTGIWHVKQNSETRWDSPNNLAQ